VFLALAHVDALARALRFNITIADGTIRVVQP
jgi:hypothetical protein